MTGSPELWQAVIPVVDVLEALGVPWHVGGSVASSFVGVARATQDADLVADLRPDNASPLCQLLAGSYYIDRERVGHAIRTRRSFNAILRLQAPRLDLTYLHTWAESLGIADLLIRALEEAGTTEG